MQNLSRKAFLFSVILTIVSIVLLDVFFYQTSKSFLTDEIISDLHRQANLAEKIIDYNAFGNKDFVNLKKFADEIRRLTGLRTTLIAKDGEVLADSELDSLERMRAENHLRRPEVQQSMQKGAGFAIRHSATIDKNLMYYAENLTREKRIIGFIRFAVFSTNFENRLGYLTNMLAIIDLLVLIIILTYVILWGKYVKKQAHILNEEINLRIEKNEFTEIPPQKYEEFDRISGGINSLGSYLFKVKENFSNGYSELLNLFNSLNEGVAAFDKDGKVIFFNNAFINIINFEGGTAGKSYFYDLIHFPPLINDIHKFLKERHVLSNRAKYFNDSYIEYQITSLKVDGKESDGFIINVEDVTHLQNLEIIRQDFVANVSHEFKTPLTSIRGYAETLISEPGTDPQIQRKFLEKIEKQTIKLENIVSDLLQLTRIENREVEELEIVDPVPVLSEIAGDLAIQCKVKNIKFSAEFETPENKYRILANVHLLQTLISNLLVNAMNYNKPEGRIFFRSKIAGNCFVIEVEDTGVGIPVQEKQRVFERFYRVESTRNIYPEGSGLGLSIVKNITELLKGKIELQSETDKGSKFTISLPLN